LAPVRKKKLSDAVIDEIRRMIEAGELKIGQKLPVHTEFAEKLEVSRTTLREAMHTLSLMGVVEQRSGFGTVIRAPVPASYLSALRLPELGGPEAIRELLDAREVVELGAMNLIVANAAESDMAAIGGCIQEMERALAEKRHSDYVKKDLEFHFLIVRAAHNRFLVQIFENLRESMEQFMAQGFKIVPGMREQSLEQHRRIYEAVRQKRRREAWEEMKSHINHRRKIFEPMLAQLDA